MGLLTRYPAGALLGLLAGSAGVCAQEYPLTKEDITPGQVYEFQLPSGEVLGTPKGVDAYRAMAGEIARHSTQATMQALRERGLELGLLPENMSPAEALKAAPGVAQLPEGLRASILISAAMGEGALAALMDAYRLRKDVRFVFRGVPDHMTVPEFALWLKHLAAPGHRDIRDLNIIIDPGLFDLAGVTLAPTLLLEDLTRTDPSIPPGVDMGRIVARGEGLTDPGWLYGQMQMGRTDHRSPNVVEVEEEDLRVRAQREAESVAQRLTRDADVIKARYWERTIRSLHAMRITPATADRERVLHFRFRTAEPIRDHKGHILAFAGEVFQPRDVLPFDRRVFVFNPNSDRELAFVEQAMKERRPGVSRTLLIVTELPRTRPGGEPWEGLQALIDRFGIQVFLLNDPFRTAFRVEASPTEIYPLQTGQGVEVLSREYALR